jgi:deuterolysin
MSSLHELSHTKGVLGFKVYGYTNILNLDTQTALKNAESYAFFSKCEFLFFPGGPVG